MNKLDRFFNTRDKWTKGTLHDKEHGSYCLLGGIYKCYKITDRSKIFIRLADKIKNSKLPKSTQTKIAIANYTMYRTDEVAKRVIYYFNDQLFTKFQDIKKLIKEL